MRVNFLFNKRNDTKAVDLLKPWRRYPAGEADAQMAYINKQGDVWATASSDVTV